MGQGELGGDGAAERMPEEREAIGANTERIASVGMSGLGVEAHVGAGGRSGSGPVAAILGEQDGPAGALRQLACPRNLPDREVGITVKGDEQPTRRRWRANEIGDEGLAVGS